MHNSISYMIHCDAQVQEGLDIQSSDLADYKEVLIIQILFLLDY